MGILKISFRIPFDAHGNPYNSFGFARESSRCSSRFLDTCTAQQHSSTAAQAAQAAQQHLKLRGFPLLKHSSNMRTQVRQNLKHSSNSRGDVRQKLKHSSNLRTQVRQKAETFTKFEGVLKMSLKISFKIPLVLHGNP